MGEWSPETYETHWVGRADHARTGARFRGWTRLGPTTTMFGRGRFTRWTCRMHPTPGGGTELEESWEQVGSVPLATTLMTSRRRTAMMQQGMEATLERIKATAEASKVRR